jgi:hypothetical protein
MNIIQEKLILADLQKKTHDMIVSPPWKDVLFRVLLFRARRCLLSASL